MYLQLHAQRNVIVLFKYFKFCDEYHAERM